MKYLVAFSVIHGGGQFMSRAFIKHSGPVDQPTIEGWETVCLYDEYARDYGRVSLRVTGFQPLAG